MNRHINYVDMFLMGTVNYGHFHNNISINQKSWKFDFEVNKVT